jgi:hypothetical protein
MADEKTKPTGPPADPSNKVTGGNTDSPAGRIRDAKPPEPPRDPSNRETRGRG